MTFSDDVKILISVLWGNKGKRAFVTEESRPLTNRSFFNVMILICDAVDGAIQLFDGDKKLFSIPLDKIESVKSTSGIESEELKVKCSSFIYRIYINENIKSGKMI